MHHVFVDTGGDYEHVVGIFKKPNNSSTFEKKPLVCCKSSYAVPKARRIMYWT